MEGRQKTISVLMFPWLAHGHISPFLELAKRLTKRNFYIYFCSTTINLKSFKPKVSLHYSKSIQLVELQLQSLPNLPPQYHTTNGLPPHLMNTLKEALDMAKPNFFTLLKTLNPDLVIYDFIQPWAATLASSLNIPSVHFFSSSAATACFLFHLNMKPQEHFPYSELAGLQDCMREKLMRLIDNSSNGIKDIDRFVKSFEQSSDIILTKTFKEIETIYLDHLNALFNKKIIAVGPLVQDSGKEDEEHEKNGNFMKWLDNKEKSSVVFVSFGSEYFLTKEEIEEIAYSLELSNIIFIWVIRFPFEKETNLEEALPKGFIDNVKERGIVMEKWAPQAKILRHRSIGGFVTHCGWSSVMESMKFGVPIIAMPMHLDQPINARIVESIGVGLEVRRNKSGQIEREEMSRVIREVVMGKGGESVRKKARMMSDCMRKNGEEEMEEVVDELVSLCGVGKKKNSLVYPPI